MMIHYIIFVSFLFEFDQMKISKCVGQMIEVIIINEIILYFTRTSSADSPALIAGGVSKGLQDGQRPFCCIVQNRSGHRQGPSEFDIIIGEQ